ncbi:MAG TPA: ATP synthase F0 subunit B [Candidatus Acidoferrales bacterium]|jgi:F0F1-type ATP synthase membrane subunit b/b'|nr:ATP synthase F0 subunit B [Candidatus Acidoferrales bacterium]
MNHRGPRISSRSWFFTPAVLLVIGGACLAFCIFTPPLSAQEKAPEQSEPAPENSPAGQLFRWLNFLLIFGGGGYLIAKKAPPYFRSRAAEISREITSATEAKAEAERQLREAETGLTRIDQESAKIRETATKEFAAEEARLREGTQREVEKVEHTANIEIDAASRAALIELRAHAARQAVERAAVLVAQQMTSERREEAFQNFIRNFPRSAN